MVNTRIAYIVQLNNIRYAGINNKLNTSFLGEVTTRLVFACAVLGTHSFG